MIPLKLIIEGIYSYQERQTIDFSTLSEVGLFGIFGAVGSGKSSLLEAITYALYGETERLNARDRRAYNMMNLKSNRSYLEFDFINFENRIFKVTREFKRNSKNFDDVKTTTVVLYEKSNEQWVPLESSNTQKIIGLSYENFKRTIIIPQGQFKEFIELGAKERTDMMKEIFQLHRFDLQDKVSDLYKKNQSELDQLNGQLLGFDDITPDRIESTQARLQAERESFTHAEHRNNILQEEFQELKNLKEGFAEHSRIKSLFQQLSDQQGEKERLQQGLNRFEEAQLNFQPILTTKEKLDKENSAEGSRLAAAKTKLEEIQQLIEQITLQQQQVKAEYERLPERRIDELDLELILQLMVFSNEIKGLQERAEKGRNFVLETKEQQIQCKSSIQHTEKVLDNLKKSKPVASELMELGQWYARQQALQQQKTELDKQNAELNSTIKAVKQELAGLVNDIEKYNDRHRLELQELDDKLQMLHDEKTHLLLQQRLSHFASNLIPGSACPLCGALEHPKIAEIQDITQDTIENDRLITETNEQIKRKREQKFEIEKLLLKQQALQEQQNNLNSQIELNTASCALHLQQFIWPNYSSTDDSFYLSQKQELTRIESQIAATEQTMTSHQATLLSIEEKLEKYSKALGQFELEEASKKAQINQNVGNLKRLNWSNYQLQEQAIVESEYNQLKISNLQLEKDYASLNDKLHALNNQFAAQNSFVQSISSRISTITTELTQVNGHIQELLLTSQFEHIGQVKETLAEELPVQKIRQELEQFRIQLETTKSQLLQLDRRLMGKVYDETLFQQKEAAFVASAGHLKLLTENVAKYAQELSQLETAYEKKEVLLAQQVKLNLRNDNLKQLFNLFKGAGFVQYVSSIYLRQLCDHANIRFHRMTRNQLSLHLNENNDFEIIDYLNEGKSRSVKTLSGGQAFQVSLSLALALAESVQSNTLAAKKFFFIDEGFGTQDINAVNIVFETLMDLHKENRIVGIISHVEELKERIPVSLSIEKDEERGSQIFIN
ncbi:SMC family ATPase [Sphingobacterium sp. N143]|uniref:AAA family ATPase n=1 Tax=Sphingobacterium sp. N143 TaxID=2746727 RepID=UPI002576A763|nr:SMC family ATPase [Sphingobacterium sp. N143]MDM1293200.1 SMC family ATPase [Sphingobacterium sp. N143]